MTKSVNLATEIAHLLERLGVPPPEPEPETPPVKHWSETEPEDETTEET
jgi:hypothetical protein